MKKLLPISLSAIMAAMIPLPARGGFQLAPRRETPRRVNVTGQGAERAALRKRDAADVAEEEAVLELYKAALGM